MHNNARPIGSTPHRSHNKMMTNFYAAGVRDKSERRQRTLLVRHKKRFREAALFLDEHGYDCYQRLDNIFAEQ